MSLLKSVLRTDRRCLRKFMVNMGWKGIIGFKKFQKRKKRGEMFPAFQFISLTDRCNLKCQGCWVNQEGKATELNLEAIDKIIEGSKKKGSYFFGLLGGEPLMYKDLYKIFDKHQDCYFQLFTNGTLLNDEVAGKLREYANVTPLISFEGDEEVADVRRGGNEVYRKTTEAIQTATRNKLITGVAISVCKSNFDMALSDEFVNKIAESGAMYLWYYIYRPSGINPCYDLALSQEQVNQLRRHIVDGRKKYPIVIIDSYWGANGEPFCPAVEGLSHHINPAGMVEPCPVIQYAKDNIHDKEIDKLYEESTFLKGFKVEMGKKTCGCILMEDGKYLVDFVEKYEGQNTSGRASMSQVLSEAKAIPSHGSSEVIREKNWMYRVAKKYAFFGLGAYG